MTCRLELRTTISPTSYFFRRIHFLAASLRAIGGALADHELIVSVGGGETPVNAVMDTYFCPRLARTLACQKAGIPCRSLPLRYNFPKDPVFDSAFPEERENAAILHYLRHIIVHRDNDFMDTAGVHRLAERTDLSGSNEHLRRVVDALREVVVGEEA